MIHLHWRRRLSALLALLACGALTGCEVASAESLNESCRALGLCDEPPKPPIAVDVLCDASVGSSCNRESLEETLGRLLAHAAERPGSSVRLWTLGKNVAETEPVGEQVVPTYPRGSEKALGAHRRRFASGAEAFLLAGARRTLDGPSVRRSPLAEAIAKIALSDAGGLPRSIVIISDAREVSAVHDFECRPIPTEARFLASLKRRNLLASGSLSGVSVDLVFIRAATIPGRGCAVDVDRELRIRALWQTALRAAGASRVGVSSGAPVFEQEALPGLPRKDEQHERHQ
jgi:hypothetical protein